VNSRTTDLETALLALISDIGDVPTDDLTRETTLDELGFDSLVLVELAMKLRKQFGLIADDDRLNEVETVGELLDLAVTAAKA
jgi:acyl carrier protein